MMLLFIFPFTVPRNEKLYEALVNMIVRDGQPFSVVEDEVFRSFASILDPTHIIPGRKALKAMVEARYQRTKQKAIAEVKQASAMSLTADMWTSVNTDAHVAVTCHYIRDDAKLATVVLRVEKFAQTHTAANLAEATKHLMAQCSIADKVVGMTTDAAHNIVVSVNQLNLQHICYFAHMLNLVVKKSLDQIQS